MWLKLGILKTEEGWKMLKWFIKNAYCSGSQPFYTKTPLYRNTFGDPKLDYNYAIKGEYSNMMGACRSAICKHNPFKKPRLRTTALLHSL